MKRLILVVIFASIVGALGLFFYVDRSIVSQLSYRKQNAIPSVYSEPFEIRPGISFLRSTVQQELNSRSYREVDISPVRGGEYRSTSSFLEIFTREFEGPDGQHHSSDLYTLAVEQAKVANRSSQSIFLEPELIAHLGSGEMRASTYLSLKEMPASMKNAVIAIEDERYYHHYGVDIIGIFRALVANVKAMRIVQGGSTLTQQLAKNLLFTPKKTIGRKLMEMAAAISLETHYTKDQILELYLNEVYLGQEGSVAIHGVAEAAYTFFGKKLAELNTSELALIAGIIQAPSAYSPKKNLRKALNRRDLVIDKLLEQEFITPAQASIAKATKIKVASGAIHRGRLAPHYVEALSKELNNSFNVDAAMQTGLRVYSGINRMMQECAERAVTAGGASVERQIPKNILKKRRLEASLVAIEPFSGKIRAWVGGRDFSENQFDHISQAKRQIGSTIKPFLYLTALDSGLNSYRPATPITILPDEPMKFDFGNQPTWEPENYDHQFRGDVTLRFALENSLNMPAAYIATRVGLGSLVETTQKFRLGELMTAVPSLALGAADTTLLRLTAGYGALANGGIYVAPRLYLSALEKEDSVLARGDLIEERVADENAVYVLTNILQGVIERGTGHGVRTGGFVGEAAGKTGTSNDARDAWFVGFTPSLVAGVWVGFDDNSKLGLTGGHAAVPIWTEFMKCVAPAEDSLTFIPPPGVVFTSVDLKGGGLSTPNCPEENIVREVFVRGTEPTRRCSLHSDGEAEREISSTPEGTERYEPGVKRRRSMWDILFGD